MARPWHETVAIAGITVAGIFEALQQASRDAPGLNVNLSGVWNYLPLAALSVGAVAWAYGRLLGTPKLVSQPHEGADPDKGEQEYKSRWQPIGVPNMSLESAVRYIAGSSWAKQNKADDSAIAREIVDKLHLARLTAFGRPAENRPIEALPPYLWRSLRLDFQSGNAVDQKGEPAFFGIQLNDYSVRRIWRWPTPSGWMAH